MNPFKNNMNSSYFFFASCHASFARGFQYILNLIDNKIVNFNGRLYNQLEQKIK